MISNLNKFKYTKNTFRKQNVVKKWVLVCVITYVNLVKEYDNGDFFYNFFTLNKIKQVTKQI